MSTFPLYDWRCYYQAFQHDWGCYYHHVCCRDGGFIITISTVVLEVFVTSYAKLELMLWLLLRSSRGVICQYIIITHDIDPWYWSKKLSYVRSISSLFRRFIRWKIKVQVNASRIAIFLSKITQRGSIWHEIIKNRYWILFILKNRSNSVNLVNQHYEKQEILYIVYSTSLCLCVTINYGLTESISTPSFSVKSQMMANKFKNSLN